MQTKRRSHEIFWDTTQDQTVTPNSPTLGLCIPCPCFCASLTVACFTISSCIQHTHACKRLLVRTLPVSSTKPPHARMHPTSRLGGGSQTLRTRSCCSELPVADEYTPFSCSTRQVWRCSLTRRWDSGQCTCTWQDRAPALDDTVHWPDHLIVDRKVCEGARLLDETVHRGTECLRGRGAGEPIPVRCHFWVRVCGIRTHVSHVSSQISLDLDRCRRSLHLL